MNFEVILITRGHRPLDGVGSDASSDAGSASKHNIFNTFFRPGPCIPHGHGCSGLYEEPINLLA